MAAALAGVWAQEGLWLLAAASICAGLVRGFTGFGTAMVFLPVAGQVLDPVPVIVTLLVIDFIGPLPAVPRALREGHRRDVMRLALGALVGAPAGIAILLILPPEVFRTFVSVLALALLVALISGVRYQGAVSRPAIYGIGAVSGVLYGTAGMPGPPVILLYMARPLPVQVIRASVLLFLFLTDILVMGLFAAKGLLSLQPVLVGICLLVPYASAIVAGAWIFDPRHERAYRRVAYAIIAASAVSGLPVWD